MGDGEVKKHGKMERRQLETQSLAHDLLVFYLANRALQPQLELSTLQIELTLDAFQSAHRNRLASSASPVWDSHLGTKLVVYPDFVLPLTCSVPLADLLPGQRVEPSVATL